MNPTQLDGRLSAIQNVLDKINLALKDINATLAKSLQDKE